MLHNQYINNTMSITFFGDASIVEGSHDGGVVEIANMAITKTCGTACTSGVGHTWVLVVDAMMETGGRTADEISSSLDDDRCTIVEDVYATVVVKVLRSCIHREGTGDIFAHHTRDLEIT